MDNQGEIIGKITEFVESIGIRVSNGTIEEATFLPGIQIDRGSIKIDLDKLKYPGDILHEAGHIAVTEKEIREAVSGNIKDETGNNDLGGEIGVILWTYAASSAIGLPLDVVFHAGGYKGSSSWFIENFESGNYIGLPVLVWMGMTLDPATQDLPHKPFPHMTNWLRP